MYIQGVMLMSNGVYYHDFTPFSRYNFRDKDQAVTQKCRYMLSRTQSMFEYSGLPDSIPARMLELYLQVNGFVGIYSHQGTMYAFFGGLGGVPDEYYRPTILTIANPALNLSINAKIHEDCEIILNDSMVTGLMPMFRQYATALVENELSMNIATINSRIIKLLSASDDRTKLSAEKYLRDIEDGKPGVIAETAFFDGIRAQPYGDTGGTQSIKNLIEHEQYLKASWWNELGLNSNYNMKRETLTDSENAMNSDALLPLIDDMLRCRRDGLERVNDMFGTDITVDLASSWKNNEIELELEHEVMAEQANDEPAEPAEQNDREEDESNDTAE